MTDNYLENNRSEGILSAISSPGALSCLTDEELGILAEEIRAEIIETTSKQGGHVASSLGAVEIILALHSLLDCPRDKIVFDVGHQAYAHKILTERREAFRTMRTHGGLGAFPRPSESEYDAHPSGHASDSLSVALGYAKARDLNGEDYKVVAVIGDAAISGGMAFEALNQIGHKKQKPVMPKMLIILNDNHMGISPNVGALTTHFSRLRASSGYRTRRDNMSDYLETADSVPHGLVSFAKSAKDSLKHFFVPHDMIYEKMGIFCMPPVDGHNIGELRRHIATALSINRPVLLHVVTEKGRGYTPAEKNKELFHGIAPFDPQTGKVLHPSTKPSYTSLFGSTLVECARRDNDIIAITAAMSSGTGLDTFSQEFPERFFDVGISEEHALGLASGLAFGHKKPVVAIYSTFMQRAIDQMIVDNALPSTNVVFAIDRAGLVGKDGPTHHGLFDLVYTRMIPHMSVIAPSDEKEMRAAVRAALAHEGCVSVRYPRGSVISLEDYIQTKESEFSWGKARVIREGEDVVILAFGRLVLQACEAACMLETEGIRVRVVDMRFAKPLDIEEIERALEAKLIVTLEEGVISGGVGQEIAAYVATSATHPPVKVLGVPDCFCTQGTVDELLEDIHLDGKGIAQSIREMLG